MLAPELLDLNFIPANLTVLQKTALDTQGFTIFPNVINPTWLDELRQAFEEISTHEGKQAGVEVSQVEGVRRLSDLVNKGTVFDQVYLHSTLLTCVAHILQQPFKLHSLNAHDPLPGEGQQALHADGSKTLGPTLQHQVVNSMWMLDDLTPDNGATRLVPGSHLVLDPINELVNDRMAPHPEEVLLCGPAGSIGVFNGSIWHSCTQNNSAKKRRVLHCAFILREFPQQTDQSTYLKPETSERISPLGRYILDV